MNVAALQDYFESVAAEPTRLGHLDCVRFVIDAERIGWNRDFTDKLGYDDRRSAVTRLRAAGGLYEAFVEHLGEALPATDLETGDIAYLHDPAVGLVLDNCLVVKGWRTIVRLPKSHPHVGWKVHGSGT